MSTDGQLTFEENPLAESFKKGQEHLKRCEFSEAEHCFGEVLEINPDYSGIVDALKAAKFWHNRLPRLEKSPKGQPRADFLLEEWKNYEAFVAQEGITHAITLRNVRLGVFNEVIRHLTIKFQELNTPDIDVLLQITEACINIEDYSKALEVVEYAMHSFKNDTRLAAFWAEAEYFSGTEEGKTKAAKLFWEVFAADPDNIYAGD